MTTPTTTTSPQPEQGQMVSVRSRNWMVTDVSASTLPSEHLQTVLESPQHRITLSSVEDDGARKVSEVQISEHFQAILGCLLQKNWTTPRLIGMAINSDGQLLGRCDGDPTFRVFLGSSRDLIQNIYGVAPVAELDGDEVGYLVANVVEIKGEGR